MGAKKPAFQPPIFSMGFNHQGAGGKGVGASSKHGVSVGADCRVCQEVQVPDHDIRAPCCGGSTREQTPVDKGLQIGSGVIDLDLSKKLAGGLAQRKASPHEDTSVLGENLHHLGDPNSHSVGLLPISDKRLYLLTTAAYQDETSSADESLVLSTVHNIRQWDLVLKNKKDFKELGYSTVSETWPMNYNLPVVDATYTVCS